MDKQGSGAKDRKNSRRRIIGVSPNSPQQSVLVYKDKSEGRWALA
jgi:hypothetical protein